MRRFRTATLAAPLSTRWRVRNLDVDWVALRKAAPAIVILGVMLLFVLLQVA